MKKFILIVLFMLIATATACQATPQESTVIQKNTAEAEQKNSQSDSTLIEPLVVPSEYQNKLISENGKFEVEISADIIVPQYDELFIENVSKATISQETANNILNVFFGESKLLLPKQNKDMTKKEIEQEIVRLKSGENSDLAAYDRDAYLESIQPDLELLEKQYEKAPDEYIPQEADGLFKPYDFSDRILNFDNLTLEEREAMASQQVEIIDVEAENEDGQNGHLIIQRDKYSNAFFSYSASRQNQETEPGAGVTSALENAKSLPEMDQKDAEQYAQEIVEKLGYSEFKLIGVCASVAGYDMDYTSYDTLKKCYTFFYSNDHGLPVNYVSNRIRPTYNEAWENELLTVFIDEKGILGVNYNSPTVVESKTNITSMISFDEIKNIFEQQAFLSHSWQEENIEKQILYIDQIKLGMGRIIENDQYKYVPVWDFYGKLQTNYVDDGTENTQVIDQEYGHSYFTINAISGAVINREEGY